jgi:peptide/nickel transport system permease protein
VWREVRRRPLYATSAIVLGLTVLTAIVAPWLPLPDPQTPVLSDRLLEPLARGADGTFHPLGTDHLGRDVLSRVIAGSRVTVGIAAAVTAIGAVAGTTLGLIGGYRGGAVDGVVMRVADLQMAFPPLLVAIFVLYVLGTGISQLIALLAAISWMSYARLTRARTLSLRTEPFVEAAVAIGASPPRILMRHILPQLAPMLLMAAVLDFGTVMLAEAGLSFLGMGVQPPASSWGSMVNNGREFIASGAWWLFLVPGFAIFITVFAANMTSRWAQELLGVARRDH